MDTTNISSRRISCISAIKAMGFYCMFSWRINPCPAEYIKMPLPLLIFSQSDYLIKVVYINSNTEWQTVQVQISWLLQKPTDLDLHCLQRQAISGFSRTRVKKNIIWIKLCLQLFCLAFYDLISFNTYVVMGKFSRQQVDCIFSYFSQKIGLGDICIKYQVLFSGKKNKKNIS